jgi:hypothetical protein
MHLANQRGSRVHICLPNTVGDWEPSHPLFSQLERAVNPISLHRSLSLTPVKMLSLSRLVTQQLFPSTPFVLKSKMLVLHPTHAHVSLGIYHSQPLLDCFGLLRYSLPSSRSFIRRRCCRFSYRNRCRRARWLRTCIFKVSFTCNIGSAT